jgi:hypothetical protein
VAWFWSQTSAEVSRKLQQMKSDCERMVEKATQESQRASMAEARVAELEKERTAMLLAKQRDDEQSRGLRLNAKVFYRPHHIRVLDGGC